MKKRRNVLATFLFPSFLSLVLLIGTPAIYAESAEPINAGENPPITAPESADLPAAPSNTVSLNAPDALRAGETVSFTFSCDGEEIRAIQGSLTYDPAVLTYIGSEAIPADWKITFSEEDGTLKYLGLSTENRGILGNTPLFSVTFRVNESAETGAVLPFTVADTTAYDGSGELTLTGGEFTFAVTRPLSTECTLTALSIKGGNLSPAFSPDVTEYSVTLPHTAHLAEISATACEYGKLKYSSRDLSVGENTVTVTVISEAGLQRVYTITVTRAADPNYVPSSDNRILQMELSDGLLFPAFSPEITEYTVYLVQGQDVTLTPFPADKAIADGLFISAVAAPESTDEAPTAGTFTMVCNAEDGTARTYTFHTILLSTPAQLTEIRRQNEEPSYVVPVVIGIVIFICATVFFLGFVMGHVLRSRKKKIAMAAVPAADTPADPDDPLSDASAQADAPAPELEQPSAQVPDSAPEAAADAVAPPSPVPKKGKGKKGMKKKH